MEYLFIIGILIALIIVVLLFKLIKNIVKTLLTLFLISIILTVVFGAIVYFDMRSFANGIKNKENMFLLNDDGFVSGFIMEQMNKTSSISKSELNTYYNYYTDEKYGEILGENYKFYIFELNSLVNEENNNYVEFLKGIATEFDVEGDYDHIPDPKTIAFIALVVDNLKQDPLYLTKSYKNGNFTMYPEPLTFKLVKMIK